MAKARAIIICGRQIITTCYFLFFKVLKNLLFLRNTSWSCVDKFGQKPNLPETLRVRV